VAINKKLANSILKMAEIDQKVRLDGLKIENNYIWSFKDQIFINWNQDLLVNDINAFNDKPVNWLIWHNTKRPHFSLNNQSLVNCLIDMIGFSRMLWAHVNI
jgi:hypothetical protein